MADEVRNPFVGAITARNYRHGRPYHHERALRRMSQLVGEVPSFPRGADVACGTGLSCGALAQYAQQVIGFDADEGMVVEAQRHDRVHYLVASAEAMPLASSRVDVATVASALHWFTPARFFAEAHRVLRPRGWLWVYDHHFQAEMEGDTSFGQWSREVYAAKYPPPQRGSGSADQQPTGFVKVGEEDYDETIGFSPHKLVDYLMSQSNVIAAIAAGRESEDEARAWLAEQTRTFFSDGGGRTKELLFHGYLAAWQRDR